MVLHNDGAGGRRPLGNALRLLLGWGTGVNGREFYVRQLRDMKMAPPVDDATPTQICNFAELCGWTLARAHAKSGEAALISGYLGKSDTFDQAIGRFAVAYADQNDKDHAALVAAVKQGRVEALVEDNL